MELEQLRYPIGKFIPPAHFTEGVKNEYINVISSAPTLLKELINEFTTEQWLTTYREGGWNATQVVNHLADSHMNGFVKFKIGLTEDSPIFKSYDELKWSMLADGNIMPPEASFRILEGLHHRWVVLLENMSMDDFNKTIRRPQTNEKVSLGHNLAIYAWHVKHHLAHLEIIKNKG